MRLDLSFACQSNVELLRITKNSRYLVFLHPFTLWVHARAQEAAIEGAARQRKLAGGGARGGRGAGGGHAQGIFYQNAISYVKLIHSSPFALMLNSR